MRCSEGNLNNLKIVKFLLQFKSFMSNFYKLVQLRISCTRYKYLKTILVYS